MTFWNLIELVTAGLVLTIFIRQEIIMTDLSNLQKAVEDETTVTKSAVTLITELAQKITDAGTDQAKLDELVAELNAQKDALAAAVTANTATMPPAP